MYIYTRVDVAIEIYIIHHQFSRLGIQLSLAIYMYIRLFVWAMVGWVVTSFSFLKAGVHIYMHELMLL